MPTAPQSTMMGQSYSISTEGLNHVVPKWSNRSFEMGHLVSSFDQWCAVVAYQIPCLKLYISNKTEECFSYKGACGMMHIEEYKRRAGLDCR